MESSCGVSQRIGGARGVCRTLKDGEQRAWQELNKREIRLCGRRRSIHYDKVRTAVTSKQCTYELSTRIQLLLFKCSGLRRLNYGWSAVASRCAVGDRFNDEHSSWYSAWNSSQEVISLTDDLVRGADVGSRGNIFCCFSTTRRSWEAVNCKGR